MKFQYIVFIINICCLSKIANSSPVTGVCKDTLGNPIAFVNVSAKMTGIGTVTDTNGFFHLNGDLFNDIDTLVFTHIGYKTHSISAKRKDLLVIQLQPSEYSLKGVTISPSESNYKNKKIIGTKANTDHVIMKFSSGNLGTEIGKIIKVKKGRKYKVEKVSFNISELDYKQAKFRINFYNVYENDSISTIRINYHDYFKDVGEIGLIEIDLENEDLVFKSDFLVAIEWIDYVNNPSTDTLSHKHISFNSTVFSGPFYSRTNNVSKWNNNNFKYNVGLGIYLLVKY